MGFSFIPPRTTARASVEGLTALKEIATELRNPVLRAGATELAVAGALASGHYLRWEGGATAIVYDANWNQVAELPAASQDFHAPTGEFDFHIVTDEGAPLPWLELQIMTRDAPIVITDQKL